MYNFFFDQFCEPIDDLFDYLEYLLFLKPLPFDQLFEVSIFAILGDDVETVFGAENVFEFNYVGMIEPLEQIDFREDRIFQVFVISESG